MPTGYVKQLAKKHHTSVGKSEAEWSKAKAVAKKEGKGENFAYITSIYKKMMGESIREVSLKQFLSLSEDLGDASEIAYGGEKEDEFSDDYDGEDMDSADDIEYGDEDDDDFEGHDGHELADVIPPDEMDDECDPEDPECELGDEDDFGDDEDFGDDDSEGDDFDLDKDDSEQADDQDFNFREGETHQFSMLKSLMLITEKKKGVSVKKAAKSVYHRDYVKTKNRPYRKYDPKQHEHQAATESYVQEKWNTEYEVPEDKKDMFKGRSKESLESELARLKASGPHKEGSAEYTKMKELNFAIRAKSGWK